MAKIEQLKEMYNLSQDYELLEKLVLEGKEIPCFVTYDINHSCVNPLIVTDIASAKLIKGYINNKYDNIMVVSRGMQIISTYPNDEYWRNKYPFVEDCKLYDLWFILPKNVKKATEWQDPIDELKIDKLAERWCHESGSYREGDIETQRVIRNAFKAGYRKAMEG